MAASLWGKVYYQLVGSDGELADLYAGELRQEPGGRCVFTYDASYLGNSKACPIAHAMPLRESPFVSEYGLHSFFDNLVAEGWLRNAQARALGVDPDNRFALLLGFGKDLAGAVSVIDPEPRKLRSFNHEDEVTRAVLANRASLSGIQRKVFVMKEDAAFRPVRPGEVSTHFAKLPSGDHPNIIELEYLTTQAVQALLPDDQVAELEIAPIETIHETALVIRRFDRLSSGAKLHFEEFNQLLDNKSGDDKYEGAYEDMGAFILNTPKCMPLEAYRLYRRVLASLLVGNTDAHFKNFAMFHTRNGLRLTPNYDLVAAAIYKYQTIAMSIGGAKNVILGKLKPRQLLALANGFAVSETALRAIVNDFAGRVSAAKTVVAYSDVGSSKLRNALIERIEKRWNGSFSLIGR